MAERSLKQPADLYVSLAFAAADVLFELDADGRVTYAVGAAMPLLGRPARLLTELSLHDLVAASDREALTRALAAMSRGERVRNVYLEVEKPGLGGSHVTLSGYAQPDRPGKLVAVMAHSTSYLPPPPKCNTPSGLMDKDSFAARARELMQAPEAEETGYRLTLLEVPEMGDLRDKVGTEAAENFAGRLGERLRTLSAGGDAAGQLSDTKYGIIHSGAVDPEIITQAVAEAAVDCPGVDLAPKAATLVLDVADLPAADAARALAYTLNAFANEEQGGSLEAIAAGLQPRLSQTASEMRAVRKVIEEGAFEMVFQPIVDLWTNVVHHFEALVRFSGNGDRSPYETITFAEDTGLIGELDLAVLRRVIAVMRSRAGANPALRFAVNLSGRSLADPRVTGQVRSILRNVPGLAGRLLFEITESAAISDLAAANAVVQEIRRMGFEVCLDDFGAGSAAFHYLRALKVDHVKIDGSYIRDCMKSNEDVAFIKSMVGLCTDLNITTIAEYVEDAPTAAMLKVMKVRYGQGWHFGKPHSPDLAAAAESPAAWAPPGSEWRRGLLYFKG
ncbi:MAG TPA: EAL domain-containing protein [Candidatus Omnitrophota bacterium]|nr:EAL domain-containing protein [Candidatus Omnitrophota bacterium]